MHIVVVGPGALGSLLTARLSLHLAGRGRTTVGTDIRITLLDYKPPRAQLLARGGLVLESAGQALRCFPEVTAAPAVCAGADILVACVKATALTTVLAHIRPFLTPKTILLGMQNGIAHLEDLADVPCVPGVGITTEGATLLSPGRVRHGGAGVTRLGLLVPAAAETTAFLARVAALLTDAGMDTRLTSDPRKHAWAKLFVNAGINALTALENCPNGDLLNSGLTKQRMTSAVREAEAVARAWGIMIDEDPVAVTFRVCQATGANISSMLQDVRNQRRTEIDAINGAVVAAGRKLGIATPVNEELVRQVKELESAYGGADKQC